MEIKRDAKVLKIQKKGDIKGLIKKALDRKHLQGRDDAIQTLGELNAKEAVPTLIEILNNKEDTPISFPWMPRLPMGW